MMSEREEVIEELTALILMQDKEIRRLKKKIDLIKQYIDTYEEYIKGE